MEESKPEFEKNLDVLISLNDALRAECDSLENCVDRVEGSVPQDATSGKDKMEPLSVLERYQDAVSVYENLVTRLGDIRSRFYNNF